MQAISSEKTLADEYKYQKLKATLELVRDLEHAGLLTYAEFTGDDRKTAMVLRFPE